MSGGTTDATALLRFQLHEVSQEVARLQGAMNQRNVQVVEDFVNGLNVIGGSASAGDPNAKKILVSIFAAIDAARSASESRLIVPAGAMAKRVDLAEHAHPHPTGEESTAPEAA